VLSAEFGIVSGRDVRETEIFVSRHGRFDVVVRSVKQPTGGRRSPLDAA